MNKPSTNYFTYLIQRKEIKDEKKTRIVKKKNGILKLTLSRIPPL